jgi:hypothetical protein
MTKMMGQEGGADIGRMKVGQRRANNREGSKKPKQ